MAMLSPTVSIIIPCRNEAQHIARCLDAILAQDYGRDQIGAVVVDGMSQDGTRDIVSHYTARDPRVTLLDNPEHIVPTGLNRGIRAARGDIVIRVDGHAVISSDYVRLCVESLRETGADCVGGPIVTIGETTMARTIALAQSSPFGVGNAAFRYADRPQYVDTLAFGAHCRELFDRIGLFDEELVRNQDDEFNFRLIKSGGKIWLDPKIRSTYYSRATLRALWKQYYEYGFWKVRVIQKHGRPASWRHLVPGAFVLALAASAIMSLVSLSPLWILLVVLPYISALVGASLWLAAKKGWQYAPLLPFAFATLHLAYGCGFLAGTLHFGLLKRSLSSQPRHT